MYAVYDKDGALIASFNSLQEANDFVVNNWNTGPYRVVNALNEETVGQPKFLTEKA